MLGVQVREQLAADLAQAERSRIPISPLTDGNPDIDVVDAYEIQLINIRQRVAEGARVVGHKVGLSSEAMQKMMNVDEPDYGHLLDEMQVYEDRPVKSANYLYPRVEVEVGFILADDLPGAGCTEDDVLAATAAFAPSIELIDTRITDWKIKLCDTIADNASSAGWVLGEARVSPKDIDIKNIDAVLTRNDEVDAKGRSDAVLGNPVTAALNEPGAPLPDRPGTTFANGRLNGTKIAVPYAQQAEWIVVTTDSAVVVVSPKADGVQLTKTPSSNKGDEYTVTFADAEADGVLDGGSVHRVNQLALAAIGAFASGLVAGALRLTADYVANRHQFGKPLSTFQTVAAQLAEVYIASRTLTLAATSVVWRLAEGRDADDDLDVLGYWLASQAPPVMQICHHLHGGMGMDIAYPMDRYYSTIKDLTRLVGGPSHRLDLAGAQCSSN
jgi:2-keto-4-pentenoate hydratase